MIVHSSSVNAPRLKRMASGVEIFPISCKTAHSFISSELSRGIAIAAHNRRAHSPVAREWQHVAASRSPSIANKARVLSEYSAGSSGAPVLYDVNAEVIS